MERVQNDLNSAFYRTEVIKRKAAKMLSGTCRERLENELREVKEILKKDEEKWESLRKENSKSFIVAVCLVFLTFVFYEVFSTI